MYRKIFEYLKEWKNSPYRKPLIIQGARQVGKTYSILNFGKSEYENIAYFNFETNPKLKETFNRLIEKDNNKYIVDFKWLIHINSLAMGILRGKLQVVREMGGDIKIVNLNKHIQTIFETIGLDEIFEIYKNEEEALKSFK
mgnify:CR=1 FL=1